MVLSSLGRWSPVCGLAGRYVIFKTSAYQRPIRKDRYCTNTGFDSWVADIRSQRNAVSNVNQLKFDNIMRITIMIILVLSLFLVPSLHAHSQACGSDFIEIIVVDSGDKHINDVTTELIADYPYDKYDEKH